VDDVVDVCPVRVSNAHLLERFPCRFDRRFVGRRLD